MALKYINLFLCVVAILPPAAAQTLTTLASFNGANGANPQNTSLIQGIDGNLYGVTPNGGAYGYGTVFRVAPDGRLTTLHSFQNGVDGAFPYGGLVQTTDGLFYGTTAGLLSADTGTVFKITPSGTLTTLHTFQNSSDGGTPYCTLTQATDGAFYGTTQTGGGYSNGTVFRITPTGTLTTLYSFMPSTGYRPFGALVQAPSGELYGTTQSGGGFGNGGTIFKITRGGSFTTIHTFNDSDGGAPGAGLLQASNGLFYGTTLGGGAYHQGVMFVIAPNGAFRLMGSFYGLLGSPPIAPLIQATDGNLYGATECCYGTIFTSSLAGGPTPFYYFATEEQPTAPLFQATDGSFYGTTEYGGDSNSGTVYSLSTGLDQFVETLPAFGRVGDVIVILGNDLSAVTSVMFNGVPAVVNSIGSSAIRVTVPPGATTGTVQVATPVVTLKSNKSFRVL